MSFFLVLSQRGHQIDSTGGKPSNVTTKHKKVIFETSKGYKYKEDH